MAKDSKNGVYQVTFVLNLLLIPFGIAILLTGIATEHNIKPFHEFLKGKFHGLSVCLIMTGIIAMAVALFGCYGVLRDRFCIIMLYPHLLLAIFAFQVVIAGLAFVQTDGYGEILDDKIIENVHNYTIQPEYMDAMQSKLKCCGFNGSDDYYDIEVPRSCCKNRTCPTIYSYYRKGCKEALEDFTATQGYIISGVSAAFAGLEICGFVYFLYCCRRMMLDRPRSSSIQKLIQEESSEEEETLYP